MLDRRRALLANSKNKIHCYLGEQLRFSVGSSVTEFEIVYIKIMDDDTSDTFTVPNSWTNGENETVNVFDMNNNIVGTMYIETVISSSYAFIRIPDAYIELPYLSTDTETFTTTVGIRYERNGNILYREASGPLYKLG